MTELKTTILEAGVSAVYEALASGPIHFMPDTIRQGSAGQEFVCHDAVLPSGEHVILTASRDPDIVTALDIMEGVERIFSSFLHRGALQVAISGRCLANSPTTANAGLIGFVDSLRAVALEAAGEHFEFDGERLAQAPSR